MLLNRFKVTNFRSVVDSGWLELERVTALIGVNESGKTNLLLPLWKLNPAREGELKPTSDYPKGNYAAVRAAPHDFQFVVAEFDCSEYADELASLSGVDAEYLQLVHVGRCFDGQYIVEFPDYVPTSEARPDEIEALLVATKAEIEAMNALAKESSVKPELIRAIEEALQTADQVQWSPTSIDSLLETLRQAIPESPATTSSIIPRFNRLLNELEEKASTLRSPDPADITAVRAKVLDHIPRFVYYSNYGNLDSEIYLPHVVENLKREDLGAREAAKARTLRVLFSFVRLQPEEILELGRDFKDEQGRNPTDDEISEIATKKRDRTILLNSAGTDLTKRFRDWWKQGDYTFEFQADGDHFRIWVSDQSDQKKLN